MMDLTYTEIHNRLFSKLNATSMTAIGLPELLWVDRENLQFERIQEVEGHNLIPVRFPAVTIQFQEISWANGNGEGIITIRVGYENYADSYKTALGSVNQSTALKDYLFLEQVHEALKGFSGTNFANLTRIAQRYDSDFGNIIVHEIDYQIRHIYSPTRTTVVLAEVCAIPAFPTPPEFDVAYNYIIGQKVTDTSTGLIYICIQSMSSPQSLFDLAYWRKIPDDSLFIAV